MFPVTLSSPPSSSPSSPPLPQPAVPSPTPPTSYPPSPTRASPFAPIPTHPKPSFAFDMSGSVCARDGRSRTAESVEASATTPGDDRWTDPRQDSSPATPPRARSPSGRRRQQPQYRSREPSLPIPSPWEGSPTSSMSTLSRMEDSLPRTSDTSPPSGIDRAREDKPAPMDDEELIVRLDGYGGGWDGTEGWRLGVDFGDRADSKGAREGDFRFPDSRGYAAHVFSAESSSGEPSPASAHRPLPPTHLLSIHPSPVDLLSPTTPVTSTTSPALASAFPSFENLSSPASPARSGSGPYLRTTSSRTTTTTTTTRKHVRGSSLSMPAASLSSRPADRLNEPAERARTRSGFTFSSAVGTGSRAASVRSWHSDEDDEDDDQEDFRPKLRRERTASETPVGSDVDRRAGCQPSRRYQASSLQSSPSQRRSELPLPPLSSSAGSGARSSRVPPPKNATFSTQSPEATRTLHRTRSSSSSNPGLGAFGFAFPTIFTTPDEGSADFDSTPTPSPTPALGGDRRRKTTKSAPSSRLNLSAMFKASGAGGTDGRRISSDRKPGGIFGLVKDGIQALHHHHQQQATEAAEAAISPNSTFSRSSRHSTSPSASYLSPTASVATARPNTPSPDEQALTIFTRPIYPIAKFATLIAISFFALLALSTVLVGSYGLTAWDVGRLRIAGARETVQGGRRLIERGVERAREAMIGTGGSPEDEAGDSERRDDLRYDDGRRPDKRTTEEAFKQLQDAASSFVRRLVPSSLTGLLFASSTRPPSSSSGRSRKRSSDKDPSSKRHHHSKKASVDETPSPSTRTAPHSRQTSRRPSVSAASPFSTEDHEDGASARSRPRSRRPSYRTPSPSPTRGDGPSDGRYTFGGSSPTTPAQPSDKRRKSSAPGLPPRPPLGLLIPSIVLTIVIAVCALVRGFIKGWQGRAADSSKGKRPARAR